MSEMNQKRTPHPEAIETKLVARSHRKFPLKHDGKDYFIEWDLGFTNEDHNSYLGFLDHPMEVYFVAQDQRLAWLDRGLEFEELYYSNLNEWRASAPDDGQEQIAEAIKTANAWKTWGEENYKAAANAWGWID